MKDGQFAGLPISEAGHLTGLTSAASCQAHCLVRPRLGSCSCPLRCQARLLPCSAPEVAAVPASFLPPSLPPSPCQPASSVQGLVSQLVLFGGPDP